MLSLGEIEIQDPCSVPCAGSTLVYPSVPIPELCLGINTPSRVLDVGAPLSPNSVQTCSAPAEHVRNASPPLLRGEGWEGGFGPGYAGRSPLGGRFVSHVFCGLRSPVLFFHPLALSSPAFLLFATCPDYPQELWHKSAVESERDSERTLSVFFRRAILISNHGKTDMCFSIGYPSSHSRVSDGKDSSFHLNGEKELSFRSFSRYSISRTPHNFLACSLVVHDLVCGYVPIYVTTRGTVVPPPKPLEIRSSFSRYSVPSHLNCAYGSSGAS